MAKYGKSTTKKKDRQRLTFVLSFEHVLVRLNLDPFDIHTAAESKRGTGLRTLLQGKRNIVRIYIQR